MSNKTLAQLINNVIGQLNGINNMILEDRDCKEVIPQIKAVKSATSSLMDKYINIKVKKCLTKLDKDDKELLSKLIKELSNA